MNIGDFFIIVLLLLVFGAIIALPYYLRNKNFLKSMAFFQFEKVLFTPLPDLQIFNADRNLIRENYTGQFENIAVTIVPLLSSYLVITPAKKQFEGTYVISKKSVIPRNNPFEWNKKAPLEYAEFNKIYDVCATTQDKSFYDLDPGQMAALLQHQIELSDVGFELNQSNIYVIGGYEQIPSKPFDLLIYGIRQLFVLNNHSKIEKALEQTVIISKIFNN